MLTLMTRSIVSGQRHKCVCVDGFDNILGGLLYLWMDDLKAIRIASFNTLKCVFVF